MALPYSDSNARPFVLSLGLHIALAVILTVGWLFSSEPEVIKPPAVMKAALVYAPDTTLKHQAKTQTQKREKPKPTEAEPVKQEQKKETPKKTEQPKPKPVDKPTPIKAEKPKEEPKPEAPKPKSEPKQEQKKAEPKKKEPEKKPEPPKKDAKQADKKQDALSQKKMENVSKDAERALEALMEHEEFEMEGEMTDDKKLLLMGLLASRVADMWERPPNSRREMSVVLAIELASNGKVISARTVKSSGNRAFDLAAEVAVRRVDTFPEIAELSPAEFKAFRKFNFVFRPDDLEY